MSVAFRRESDEEHLEPKFELPIPTGPNPVTPRGAQLIAEKVAQLEAAVAAAEGEAKKPLQRELRYWHTRHATAEIARAPAAGEAGIGTRVRFTLHGKPREITIVGHDEADPDAGLIAFSAPLAQAMVGLTAGELNDFAGKPDAIEVLAVEPLSNRRSC